MGGDGHRVVYPPMVVAEAYEDEIGAVQNCAGQALLAVTVNSSQAFDVLLHLVDGVLVGTGVLFLAQAARWFILNHEAVVDRVGPAVDKGALPLQAQAKVEALLEPLEHILDLGHQVCLDTRALGRCLDALCDLGGALADKGFEIGGCVWHGRTPY